MDILKKQNGTELQVSLIGRLDTTTAPSLETAFKDSLDGITSLTLDFNGLEYISSAGLRVLLATQKKMNKLGKMTLQHVNQDIREVFDITGFSNILTIE